MVLSGQITMGQGVGLGVSFPMGVEVNFSEKYNYVMDRVQTD